MTSCRRTKVSLSDRAAGFPPAHGVLPPEAVNEPVAFESLLVGCFSRHASRTAPFYGRGERAGPPRADRGAARKPERRDSAGEARQSGERMPLACRFRRPAENLVPPTFPCDRKADWGTTVWMARPNRHAGRVRSPAGRGLHVQCFSVWYQRRMWLTFVGTRPAGSSPILVE